MVQLLKPVKSWLERPDFNDHDKNQSAFYLQFAALIFITATAVIGGIYAISGRWDYVLIMFADMLSNSLVLLLVRRKLLQPAILLFSLSLLVFETYGVATGGGIHSLSSILYPILMIMASLLLRRRAFILFSAACIASVAFVVYAEYGRILPPYVPDPVDWSILITFSLILLASAFIIRFVTESLQTNLRRARQHEQELATQKEILDRVGQAVVACQMDGAIVYWNKAATDFYGWSSQEIIGKKFHDVVHVSTKPETEAVIRTAMLTGTAWSGEFVAETRAHKLLPAISTVAPLHDETGAMSGWVGIVADISERKQVELRIQQRAEQLAIMNEISRAVSALQDLGSVLEIIYRQVQRVASVDAFFICIYDHTSQQVSYPIIYDLDQPYTHPTVALDPLTWIAGVIRTGKPFLLNREAGEMQEPTPDKFSLGNLRRKSASILLVPLLLGEHVLGVISVQSYSFNAYSAEIAEILTGVGYQAAIAIENARLFTNIQTELAERQRVEAEVRKLNAGLELRVAERTQELEAAVNELESFSYTVGHDLRAPLRGVQGFSKIILQDYGDALPADVIDKLILVENAGKTMGELVDALLDFSRLTRISIHRKPTNLSALSKHILMVLQEKQPQRQVGWQVADDLIADADRNLVQIVLQNLLENAWKFTSRRIDAHIEVGLQPHDGRPVFFVRDNGVGFDMQYTRKLFQPFQKLHSPDEFPGHGIGLVTAQRIIQRHGGRIWAQAEVDKGALFCFTLESGNGHL